MIEELIKKIAEVLDEEKIPYMIIGGQAVLLYGRPRLTRDIDIALGADTDRFAAVEGVCRKLKLRILPERPEDFVKETKVLPAEEPDLRIRVDFVFSFSKYERQALERTKEVLINNYPVKFASCEDVIIHKMIAGRAVDEEDVKSILLKNAESIDVAYVRKWLSEFSGISEYGAILETFNSLWKR